MCHIGKFMKWLYERGNHVIIYNYRLLMRSTRYHVDRVWYWLTDAVGGGIPISDKVYMVPSRPKSKVYNCFIKLSGILTEIDFNNKETSMALSASSKNRREMRCVYCDNPLQKVPIPIYRCHICALYVTYNFFIAPRTSFFQWDCLKCITWLPPLRA